MADLAIIGGSGLNALTLGSLVREQSAVTPYGECSAPLRQISVREKEILFLPRHGTPHHIPPHQINYRANLFALKEQGVRAVVAVTAVGGIGAAQSAGVIAIPHQIIDYTYGREHTYYDGQNGSLEHIDFTYPFDEPLRQTLLQVGESASIALVPSGVYGATQGPRLETSAEIDRLERDGCTLVGMTGMPEAALARELGLDYVMVSLVVNPAAGRSPEAITLESMREVMEQGMKRVELLLDGFIDLY